MFSAGFLPSLRLSPTPILEPRVRSQFYSCVSTSETSLGRGGLFFIGLEMEVNAAGGRSIGVKHSCLKLACDKFFFDYFQFITFRYELNFGVLV